jgi:signal transduction histidine kinase
MSLSRKFVIVLISSILFIACVNIVAIYFSYSIFLKDYLSQKIQEKTEVTIDYINDVIEKQALDDIDNIFNDVELQFFELLENSNGTIKLTDEKNINIVVDYLLKSWVSSKYIEQIIPANNFQEILDSVKNTDSLEYRFIRNIFGSVVSINLFCIVVMIATVLWFTNKTLLPIRKATDRIKDLKPWKTQTEIQYDKKDEIGLLIASINGLNKRLNVQENIRNRLLADISHELKTPITSIQCYLEWISDGVIELSEKNLAAITDEMKRLIKLVNTIMEFEKFENSQIKLQSTEENIPELLKTLSETHKTRLKETNQKIKVTGEPLQMRIDRDLLKQMAHNIIWNFIKYAGNGTVLTINVTKNYIDFKDNGRWVSQKQVPFLTEKFYQAKDDKSGKIEERGIWVWLSIVEKIVDAHGWDMTLKSEEGNGFSIKVFF